MRSCSELTGSSATGRRLVAHDSAALQFSHGSSGWSLVSGQVTDSGTVRWREAKMADESGQLRRTGDSPDAAGRGHSARPYRPPAKVHFAMFMSGGALLMIATLMIVGGHRTWWTWIFPAVALAGSVYGYLHARSATTPGRGFAWVMVQVVCGLGAFALLAIPAKY